MMKTLSLATLVQDACHLFFPHICAGCGNDILSRHSHVCMHCINSLPLTNFHIRANNPVEKIFWGRIRVAHATSFCYFTKDSLVQRLLFQLKYKGHQELGYVMGKWMGETLRQSWRFNGIEALLPLPLFTRKKKIRGYNQAALLCKGMAECMKVPVLDDCMSRISATETQTHKGRSARWQNMEGKFHLKDAGTVSGKHVLLVDDVITTGASLESCGHALLAAGNVQLSIASFAYTLK